MDMWTARRDFMWYDIEWGGGLWPRHEDHIQGVEVQLLS